MTCAADITQDSSTGDVYAQTVSCGNTLWHSPVYGSLRPKHVVAEGLMTLAENKMPETTLLIGLSEYESQPHTS